MSDASGASREQLSGATRANGRLYTLVPWRFAALCAAIVGLPLSLLVLEPTAPQNGIGWDLLMNAGFVGAVMMIVLPLVSPRLWLRFGGDPRALRTVLNMHADLSYAAVALVVVHTIVVTTILTVNDICMTF